MMTGKEAVEYIHSVSWLGSRPGLERIHGLSSLMGNPERELKCIHVAGTNGKGSFCAMLSNILREAGYKTGLFTSPYVVCFNERIQINGEMISDAHLGEVTEYVKGFADRMSEAPTEFELLTAIAFEYFKREKCDYVVLETGLGGRLDSTNIIDTPVLSVITGIDLDHTAVLGDTAAQIAYEKSGIIKDGCPVVFGEGAVEALSVVAKTAAEKKAPLYTVDYGRLGEEKISLDGTEFVFDKRTKYRLSLLGEYQTRNAAVVLTAVEALRKIGVSLPEEAVKHGLSTAEWPARFELLSKDPQVIYDGAHNPQGIAAAVKNIKLFFGDTPVIFLTGVMADKDHAVMTSALSAISARVHTVTPNNPRAMRAEDLAREFRAAGADAEAHESFDSAVSAAVNDAVRFGAPVIALGSLYMYADVAESVRKYTSKL